MEAVEVVDDPTDDDFELLASIETELVREFLPGEPAMSGSEMAAMVRSAPANAPLAVVRAGVDGAALVELATRETNQHVAWAWTLGVRPSARRRGIGTALHEAVRDLAARDGRTTLIAITTEGDDGAASFCVRAGGRPDLVEHLNRCVVAELDRAMLQDWIDLAPQAAAGYSLVSFDGPVPDDLLSDIAGVAKAMDDAPKPEVMDDWDHTPATERAEQDAWLAQGYDIWTVAARHDATGELAGYSQLLLNGHRRWLAEQQNTGVLARHRGKRIGQWLKAVNALRLLDERPEITTIETGNAASNAPMLRINHQMGFRLAVAHRAWAFDV